MRDHLLGHPQAAHYSWTNPDLRIPRDVPATSHATPAPAPAPVAQSPIDDSCAKMAGALKIGKSAFEAIRGYLDELFNGATATWQRLPGGGIEAKVISPTGILLFRQTEPLMKLGSTDSVVVMLNVFGTDVPFTAHEVGRQAKTCDAGTKKESKEDNDYLAANGDRLIALRGGCQCPLGHPPCGACSDPVTKGELQVLRDEDAEQSDSPPVPKADADGWIEHDGKGRPPELSDDTPVEVKVLGGADTLFYGLAPVFSWRGNGRSGYVSSYRVAPQ